MPRRLQCPGCPGVVGPAWRPEALRAGRHPSEGAPRRSLPPPPAGKRSSHPISQHENSHQKERKPQPASTGRLAESEQAQGKGQSGGYWYRIPAPRLMIQSPAKRLRNVALFFVLRRAYYWGPGDKGEYVFAPRRSSRGRPAQDK
eukprot:1187224-Prorocentrum_minimum.AAC.1